MPQKLVIKFTQPVSVDPLTGEVLNDKEFMMTLNIECYTKAAKIYSIVNYIMRSIQEEKELLEVMNEEN